MPLFESPTEPQRPDDPGKEAEASQQRPTASSGTSRWTDYSTWELLEKISEYEDERRRQRIQSSRGWTWDEVLRRQARQFPLSRKRALADFLCTNDGNLDALRAAAQRILTEVSRRFNPSPGQNKCRSGPGPT